MSTKGNRFPDNLVKKPEDIRTQEEQLLNAPYGQQGAVVLSEEDVRVPVDFYCVMALRDDVILGAEITVVNWDELQVGATPIPSVGPQSWITDIPLPVGMPFYGNFTSVGLTDQGPSGHNIAAHCPTCPKLIAYYK